MLNEIRCSWQAEPRNVEKNLSLTIQQDMAEKKPAFSYDEIIADIRARRFSPVYILMGEEPYYIDQITQLIAATVVPEDMRDFAQNILYGADVRMSQVLDLARQLPMMAERQTVIVREAKAMKGAWDALENYLENPAPSTVLVFCYKGGTIDRRKTFMKKAEKAGVVFESVKKKDWELPTFIKQYAKECNVAMDEKSVMMIADHVGADLNRLTTEIDKVVASLPEGETRITPEIVEQKIGISKEFNPFELRNAIVQRDAFKAYQIVSYYEKKRNTDEYYSSLPQLFNFFQNLMIAYYAPERNNAMAVAQHLGYKAEWAARDYITGMRNYSARKVMNIISKFREVDAKSKGLDNPNTSIGQLFRELIFFILN